ncbi:cation transporter [Veillonella parvula DSM 2008]|uniref:TrkH family potassium uptake protein n=1 Tax=Veillonella parvula TaxID=29466 RepID=UPI00019D64DE|nr:TrkH family potassium uptake protein [Veillonella parvula]ACZ24502.1 cation transporter [Veillonella parvula DSM 2008]QQB16240.1 TrkH family potassium uptake protein [Veillonella parvula]SNU96974.1 Trk system potassium uptake protein trkG [Veillonella parvula]
MRIQIVMSLVGRLLYIFGAFTLIPFIYSVVFETAYWSFLITTSLSLVLGTFLSYYGCESQSFSIRDGFLVVSATWIFTVILGSLPFLGSGILTNIFDALFEATSGITATGATIIYSVDELPNTFVLWRGLMHWVGGMGIIVLILSFLKNLGADAAHFFNAEASVPKPGIVMPRIQSMATKLWQLYIAFTALCFLMLWAGGIEPFDALNYAFSIIATGGFAPTSAGAFIYEQSNYICFVFIFFMFLAGGNFSVYYNALQKGIRVLINDFETRMYWLVVFIGIAIVSISLALQSSYSSPLEIVRNAAFNLVSLQTGSGFAISDYDLWPAAAQMMLFICTFFGGCSGSTTGGVKIIRLIILIKSSIIYLRKSIHPDMVQVVRINGKPMPTKWIQMTHQFLFLYLMIYVVSVFLMTCTGLNTYDSMQVVTAFLSNVGLGFGGFGPTDSFNVMPDTAKCIAIVDMLLGRLELFTILVMLHPQFWEGYFIKKEVPKRYRIL